jgi:hypothetical protein
MWVISGDTIYLCIGRTIMLLEDNSTLMTCLCMLLLVCHMVLPRCIFYTIDNVEYYPPAQNNTATSSSPENYSHTDAQLLRTRKKYCHAEK